MSATISSEEDVKIHYLPAVLTAAGYSLDRVAYNVTISVKQGRKSRSIFADAVVYADDARTTPLVVVETKPPLPLGTGDADQAFSYARLLTPIAPVVLLTNGKPSGTVAYDTFSKKAIAGGLPTAAIAAQSLSKSPNKEVVAEAKHEIFKVDSVQEYKRILRASHSAIRNNEGFDPTKAFDELSKVMFTKLYEEKSGKDRFTVKSYDSMLSNGVNIIQTMFDETSRDPQFAGLFAAGDSIELSPRTIRELVGHFEGYDLSLTDFDVKGEAFEHFLGDTFTGGLGQYFTPRNVVNFMVDALDPKPGEKVVDPFCGTGGFLIRWHEVVQAGIVALGISEALKEEYTRALNAVSLYGIDWNERTSLACRMNMTVHGEGQSANNIFKQSGFEDAYDTSGNVAIGAKLFDVVLTNPPFGSAESDPKILEAHDIGAGRKSIERAALAMERAITLTKPGGKVGIIVMDGILSNSSMKFVRDYVRKHAVVKALISLPPETFEGYGGRADTTVLFLEKRSAPVNELPDEETFMAVCNNTGYAANGAEIAGNELPSILKAYASWRDAGVDPQLENAWVAPVRERLDPRHYWRPSGNIFTAGALDVSLASLTGSLADATNELAEVQLDLASLTTEMETATVRLGDLLEEVVDVVRLQPAESYKLLGVRWWGAGAFVREEKLGSAIGSATLRRVQNGTLIYNRLFAFRASFAVVDESLAGAYASAEFPMYEAKNTPYDAKALKQYLVHALNSPNYLAIVDAESSGSTKTSRNRFKQSEFESFRVAVPTKPEDLETIVALLNKADRVRERLAALGELAKPMRDGFAEIIPTL